jgi:uncharacterized protein YdeI (YjbR/CyaY-like superfamily)
MKITSTFTARNSAEWRAWLAANHDKEREVWLVYFKASSGLHGIDYETSVEEALCFGWVDSIIQKIDEEKYARKFNPRRAGSFWSASNKKRMEKLIAEGRMTAAGLANYDPLAPESTSETGQKIRRGELPVPAEITLQIQNNAQAWQAFEHLQPSHQRQYMSWVLSAKRTETQQKRLAEMIATLEQGKKLGLK